LITIEDVYLRHICDYTHYCAHHRSMDVPQYVHIDETSDFLS